MSPAYVVGDGLLYVLSCDCCGVPGSFMKYFVLIICVVISGSAYADLASTSYVNTAIEEKVSTSANSNQTMAGTYDVTGVMTVETPPLPPIP